MELSYSELRKREVININDGKSLGFITDITLSFPRGTLVGITVPEHKTNWLCRLFNKTEVFIGVESILKIGNDVILVDLKCGDLCAESIGVGKPAPKPKPPSPPCQPQCRCDNGRASCEQLICGIREDGEDYC
jgi:YlmC/YmxH family sporulation protein